MIKIANNLKYMVLKQAAEAAAEEELVGNQDELDVNNNEQLDAEDFKMLRAKKSDFTIRQSNPMLGLLLGGSLGTAGGYFASDDKTLAKKNKIRNAIIAGIVGASLGSKMF